MDGTFGPWGKTLKALAAFPKDLEEAKRKALLKEGHFFRNKILEGIKDQAPGGKAFKPLSPATIAIRRFLGIKGTKALIEHGDLRNGISVQAVEDEVFIGVLRTAKTADGKVLADVAKIQEEGSRPIVIKMTPKMAALLHAAFRAAGMPRKQGSVPSTGIITIQIPARPFMGPVFEKYGGEEASKRFAERLQEEINKAGGTIWSRV